MRFTLRCIGVLFVALSSLLTSGSCSDSNVSQPPAVDRQSASRGREERLAGDISALDGLIDRIQVAGLDERIESDISNLLTSAGKNNFVRFSDWTFRTNALRSYLRITKPYKGRDEIPFGIDFAFEGHPVTFMSAYASLLREHGIDLLIVPVPHRCQVYGDCTPTLEHQDDFPGAHAVHAKLLKALAEAGVEVVNLLPSFVDARYDASGTTDELLFFRSDPHWTPRGVALAADQIASRVREFSWFAEVEARPGEHFRVLRESGIHEVPGVVQGTKEPVTVWYQRVIGEDGRPVAARDRQSPILLLGDSFAGYYQSESSDLRRQLHVRLGSSLDGVSSSGFGGTTIWKAVQRRNEGLAGKRLVIWVFRFGLLSHPKGEIIDPFE
jgi:hypothetical protein